ncbi:MAG: hypothetical protein JO303_14735 [Caulobacteraceae bacterium]|nr:hypothetical protein [Caulobacteraceae bacterium]
MQTAQSEDWRPGFAKRSENFFEVCAAAESWRWSPGETVARVAGAVLKGTPTLTIPQRTTLLLYVEHLNQDRLEQDIACVWPSTHLVARYLGCSESQARANRRALEAAGFLVRDYTRANRPAGVEAYDLRPLMARLDELEAVDDGIRAEMEARRAAYSDNVVFPTRYSAQAPESRRLEQSQSNFKSSVREKAAAPPRSQDAERAAPRPGNGQARDDSGQRTGRGADSALGSPTRARVSAGASLAPSAYAEMVRQELVAAAQVCPRLAPLVTPAVLANPAEVAPEVAARVAAAAGELLPQPERNNDQTALWGWRKHGVRVLVMLAIALEDPEVNSPCGYFGRLTGQDRGAADLRLNLARILKGKGVVGPPPEAAPAPVEDPDAAARRLAEDLVAPPGAEDPKWQAIAGELRRILREGKFGSWFGRVGFHGVTDGVLHLSTPSGVAADRIRAEFIPDIKAAAEAADVFVERVVITMRKT